MKIQLDECVPVQVRNALVGHDVPPRSKWAGVESATGNFFNARSRTASTGSSSRTRTFRYQQNLKGRNLAILELWTNHRPTLEKHLDKVTLAAERISAGEYIVLENPE